MKFIMLLAAIAIVIAGCGDSGSHPAHTAATTWSDSQTIRVREDRIRNRIWVLGVDHVDVYHNVTRKLIQRIDLAGWSVAEDVCQPDIVLDRSGAAFISHNLQPRLWRIDADSFQLEEYAIRLLKRESWDTGFGGLAFAPDGTLYGVTAFGGSLWRIDIGNASAHQVELDPRVLDGCDLLGPALSAKSLH